MMSSFARKLQMGSVFNRAAYAGPRRFLIIGGGVIVVAAAITYVSFSGSSSPLASQVARLPSVNPLPGGLQSNPQQDKLALATNREQADQAVRSGLSYTPPIAASQPLSAPPASGPTLATPASLAPPAPLAQHVAAQTPPTPAAQPLHYTPDPMVHTVAQTTQVDPQEQQAYNDAINRLLRGWSGRSPRTDIQIQPMADAADAGRSGQSGSDPGPVRTAAVDSGFAASRSTARAAAGRLLLPAGRGVFAHTILAVSSDSDGPVVLQADSGPLAGDRMIGSFGKATSNGTGSADRLVVRVNTIEHQGQSIGVDAIVTAPETMETTVASSVDEHYLARFALPAAAAFVQGLGQALATTSNTNGVLSPLGGTSYSTQLNFPQQLGVGAGVAAQQLGNTLNQQAPRGPTVHLDANVNVGVMFLAAVRQTAQQ
ncbi:DotG/IcmE/VirB10 family protein [Acidisphaera sp. L21]|uniref:DotG/IcmE/VirB10 family protein n=1 Tax=Acidisphaera sp. L21 TaxID=1641851 RepID=UPI00131CC52E|nr:DotG/IcmE/VirB10 family protein [Acidisphaera sp. L21]